MGLHVEDKVAEELEVVLLELVHESEVLEAGAVNVDHYLLLQILAKQLQHLSAVDLLLDLQLPLVLDVAHDVLSQTFTQVVVTHPFP